LEVVEWEAIFVSPSIEALISIKTIVGITNKVDILGGCQVVDAHVAYFFALFTCYSSINHFEMIDAWFLKLLHKKINLGGEYVDLFKLVNHAGVGLSALLIPALVRGHLLNRILSHNSDSECAADLQEVLKMSISILQGLTVEWTLLHHVDESWFKFEIAIFNVHLRTSPDVGTRWS
jgi:hypothetical protein